jgi:hypothetical protein
MNQNRQLQHSLLELFGEQDVQLLDPAFPWLFLDEWLAFSNEISTLKRDEFVNFDLL